MEYPIIKEQLSQTCGIFENHLDVWAATLHLYPKNWRPPLRLSPTFNNELLNSEPKMLVEQSRKKLQFISNKLYEKKIPETGSFDPASLDLFENSIVQQFLNES